MAKKTEDTGEALLEAINAHIAAQLGNKTPAKEEEAEETAEAFEWPELSDINSMKLPALGEIAEAIELDLEDQKLGPARTLLATARSIALDEDVDDLDDDDVNALAEALDIEPAKKVAKTVEALKEYLDEKTESDTAEPEEDAKPTKDKKKPVVDEEEEASKKKKGEKEEESSDSDGVDREEVADEFDDFPDDDEMRERLEAFNEAQDDEDNEIEVPKKDGKPLQAAYKKLVVELVDSEKEIAEWGEPYARDEQAYCCGMPLEEVEVKGVDDDCGQCQVTDKIFKTDEDGNFVELKQKKK